MANQQEGSTIRVLSWNIHGLKAKLNKDKKEQLLKIIKDYDVVLLQETRIGPKHADPERDGTDLGILRTSLEGYNIVILRDQEEENQQNNRAQTMYLTYFSSRRRGVAIIINKQHTFLRALFRDGDYVWVHVEIDGQKYTFMSVYYHQTEEADLMDSMSRLLTERSEAFRNKFVIGGDFNTTLDPNLDAVKTNRAHDTQRERLRTFMKDGRLSDVWRRTNPGIHQYTFSTREPKSRLDYIFMLEEELGDVQICEINDIDLSDHFPVTLTLKTLKTLKTSDLEDVTSKLSEVDLKK